MRDSDWSRENLLRSDWSVLKGATYTTQEDKNIQPGPEKQHSYKRKTVYEAMQFAFSRRDAFLKNSLAVDLFASKCSSLTLNFNWCRILWNRSIQTNVMVPAMFWHAGPTTSNDKWTWWVLFAFTATEGTSSRYNVLSVEYFFDQQPLAFDHGFQIFHDLLIRSSNTGTKFTFWPFLVAPPLLSCFDFCCDLLAF